MGLFSGIKKLAGPVGAIIGGAIGGPGGAALGASLGGSISAADGARQQNEANSAQAQRQMDFQERMSNTSWRRGMRDMRKAGLNPIFAYKAGGASTPQGAQATMVNENMAGIEGLSKISNSAMALNQHKQQLYNLGQQGRLTNMQVSKESAQTGLLGEQENATRENINRIKAETNTARAVANAEAWKSKLIERDIKYKLANPHLMKGAEWTKYVNNIMGNIPVLGKTIHNQ